jgi:hypothetical protein
MNGGRTHGVVGLLVTAGCLLVFIGGCANPRGTASALSAVIPVSGAATSRPPDSSPAVSSPAASSAGLSTSILDSTQIRGAVTADSPRQLVISYIGGACDASARGEAAENGPSVVVHVLVTVLHGVCTAQRVGRTAVAPLPAPWGGRVVTDSTGATVPVLDGALLLHRSWLPAGYEGGFAFVDGSDG